MDAGHVRRAARWRRALFFFLTLVTAAVATAMMCDILAANGLNTLERIGLVLFYVLFVWITGAFWTALAGMLVRLRGGDPLGLKPEALAGRPLAGRIAIIMPIYNEDTTRVIAGLDVIWSSLSRLPEQPAFDLFILSDTRKLEIAAAEEAAWRAARGTPSCAAADLLSAPAGECRPQGRQHRRLRTRLGRRLRLRHRARCRQHHVGRGAGEPGTGSWTRIRRPASSRRCRCRRAARRCSRA